MTPIGPRSQITILDVAALAVMFALGLSALKLAEGGSGLAQLGAFVAGLVSLPVVLWTLFTIIDRRRPPPRNGLK